jgi:hypothetical protein
VPLQFELSQQHGQFDRVEAEGLRNQLAMDGLGFDESEQV